MILMSEASCMLSRAVRGACIQLRLSCSGGLSRLGPQAAASAWLQGCNLRTVLGGRSGMQLSSSNFRHSSGVKYWFLI